MSPFHCSRTPRESPSERSLIRKGVAAIALLACAACATAATSPVQQPPAVFDSTVNGLLAESGVPSVSAARIVDGRIAWAAAWGEQSPGVRATRETLYNIASLTKPISAETIVRAAAAGRLSLDEPMSPHWIDPDLRDDPRHRLLTPRLALTHRTGFPNWRDETGGRLAFRQDPGGAPVYSGEGFEYLARFAERRTGRLFEALAEELVFAPSGMRSTAYTKRGWFAGRLAVPTDQEGRPVEIVQRDAFVASDDVFTTASDYARFLIGVARAQGLDPATAADRERVQASRVQGACAEPGAPACPDEMGFGLGWDVAAFGDERVLWHTGSDRGEFTFAYVIPSTGEGMVILTNSAVGYRIILPLLEQSGASPRFLAFLRAQAG